MNSTHARGNDMPSEPRGSSIMRPGTCCTSTSSPRLIAPWCTDLAFQTSRRRFRRRRCCPTQPRWRPQLRQGRQVRHCTHCPDNSQRLPIAPAAWPYDEQQFGSPGHIPRSSREHRHTLADLPRPQKSKVTASASYARLELRNVQNHWPRAALRARSGALQGWASCQHRECVGDRELP